MSDKNRKRLMMIPARGGSKRIEGKNIRKFCGKPLIAYSLEVAKESKLFDVIHVSTEDIEIRRTVEQCGFLVDFLREAFFSSLVIVFARRSLNRISMKRLPPIMTPLRLSPVHWIVTIRNP